jgi:hypothetical protein
MTALAATFQNRIALFLWGFAAVWLTILVAMTYVVLRDGPPAGSSVPMVVLIMSVFWICAIGLGAFISTKPCFFVTVDQGSGVTATWRYPHKVVRKVLRATSVKPAAVISSQDSEGGPYFYARVISIGGESIDIAEATIDRLVSKLASASIWRCNRVLGQSTRSLSQSDV